MTAIFFFALGFIAACVLIWLTDRVLDRHRQQNLVPLSNGMYFDPTTNQTIMFGGAEVVDPLETWTLTGDGWERLH